MAIRTTTSTPNRSLDNILKLSSWYAISLSQYQPADIALHERDIFVSVVATVTDKVSFAVQIHGWPDLSMGWRYQIPLLVDMGFRVLAPDMMGYGGTVSRISLQSCYTNRSTVEQSLAPTATYILELHRAIDATRRIRHD